MKFIKLMVVTLALVVSAASASYAAVAFISSSTLNMIAPNARNGLAGNISLTVVAPGATSTVPSSETLIISYGSAQISVLSTICVKATIGGTTIGFGTSTACMAAGIPGAYIFPATGVGFTGYGVANSLAGVMSVTVNQSNISIVFLASPSLAYTGATDGFEISGVRLNVVPLTSGTTIGSTIQATISSTLSQISTTNPNLPIAFTKVPISILPGTAAVTAGVSESVSTIVAIEGDSMLNAFETNGAATPTQVIFNITNIPAGVNVTGAAIAAAPTGYTRVGSTAMSIANGMIVGATTPIVGFTQTGTTAIVTVDILSSNPSIQEVAPVAITFSAAAVGTTTATLGPEVAGASGATLTLPATGLPFGATGPVAYQAQYGLLANSFCDVNLTLSWTGVLNTDISLRVSQPANFDLNLDIMDYTIPLISAVAIPAIDPAISVSIPLAIPSFGNVGVLIKLVTLDGILCSNWKTVYTGPKAP